jgi:hypothetical protein
VTIKLSVKTKVGFSTSATCNETVLACPMSVWSVVKMLSYLGVPTMLAKGEVEVNV